MRRALTFATLFALGCTFTGLGRYDLGVCNSPVPISLADDPCRALDGDEATGCLRYQCNADTGRCEQRPLDYDRDGDPSLECGGHDCDDHDPKRRSGAAEVCDGIDNDCNGIEDDGELTAVSSKNLATLPSGARDVSLRAGLGAAVANSCVLAFQSTGELLAAPCTFPAESTVTPITPAAISITAGDVTFATAFVNAPLACPQGQLAYRNTKSGHYDGACATEGVTWPALAPYPSGDRAAVAYIARAYTSLVIGCDATLPAPLDVLWLSNPSTTPAVSTQRLGLASTLGTRPPVLVPRGSDVLLAAPADGAVSLWSLGAETVVPLLTAIPALANARSLDLALDDTTAHLAIVAELGCAPSTRVVLLLADAADPGPVVTVKQTIDVASAGTAPRVAWQPARAEWWVTYQDDAGLETRRFTPNGVAASDAILLSKTATQGVPDGAGIEVVDGEALEAVSLGCR